MLKRASGVTAGALLFVVIAGLLLLRYDRTTTAGDIALYLNPPVRMLQGQLPYRDFWMPYPPGTVYVPFLLFKLFGHDINAVLLASVLVTAMVGVMAFALGREISGSTRLGIVSAVLVVWCGVPAHYIGPTYLHMPLLLALGAALAIVRYTRRRSSGTLLIAGLCLGAALLFRFFEIGAVIVGACVAVAVLERAEHTSWSRLTARLGVLALGAALPPVMAGLALRSIVVPMMREIREGVGWVAAGGWTFFWGVTQKLELLSAAAARFRATMSPLDAARLAWDSVIVAGVTFQYLFPVVVLVVIVCYARSSEWSARDTALVCLFALWAVLHLPKASLGSSALSKWVHVTTPLFFVFPIVWRIRPHLHGPWVPVGRAIAILALVALLLPVPLALAQSVREALRGHVAVTTDHARLKATDLRAGRATAGVVDMIQSRTTEADAIFVVPPDAPAFHALTGRRNPTRYDTIVELHIRPSPEKQAAVCADLLRGGTKLVIHYGGEGRETAWGRSFEATNPDLSRCLRTHFREIADFGAYAVWAP